VHEDEDIELPENLGLVSTLFRWVTFAMQLLLIIKSCWQLNFQAICREFLPYLDDDDGNEEKANLAQLSKGRENLTPEEREAAAKPTEAGQYWKPWTPFRAAQRLFVDEVALIDEASRDKKKQKNFWQSHGSYP
jgi:hypothetical protein